MQRAAVVGSGTFGSAMAAVLAQNAAEVRLWGRDEALVEGINTRSENQAYLPGLKLPSNLRATTSLEQALEGAELVVLATPSHAKRGVLAQAVAFLPTQVPIVTVAKGIEAETLYTMTELMEDVLPEVYHPYLAVLSGPSFARELAARMPTAVTVAARWEKVAVRCQRALQTETLRLYTSPDVVGVQYGGALKNVMAIAAGIADGLGFGHNARAAIITRGLAELTRVAVRKGANPLTLSGLSGMGDLVLTCTGELSRNRRVGLELGKGKTLESTLAGSRQVAEGVNTAQSAKRLAMATGIELPICEQVHAILFEGKDPRTAVVELMTRAPKSELER